MVKLWLRYGYGYAIVKPIGLTVIIELNDELVTGEFQIKWRYFYNDTNITMLPGYPYNAIGGNYLAWNRVFHSGLAIQIQHCRYCDYNEWMVF